MLHRPTFNGMIGTWVASTAATALVAGGATLIVVRRLQRSACSSCHVEEVAKWLEANRLGVYVRAFARHGYDELQVLADLSEKEIEELLAAVRPCAGHAAKLRRCLAALRAKEAASANMASQALEPTARAAVPAQAAAREPLPLLERPSLGAADEPPPGPSEDIVQEIVEEPASDGCADLGAAPAACGGVGAGAAASATAPGFGLYPGARVVLFGLEKRPELNGRTGTISNWDPQNGRWTFTSDGSSADGSSAGAASPTRPRTVQPAAGQSIRVRAENVRLADGAPSQAASLQVPNEFRCCITQELMERPVITSDGHTYERSAIARWLEEHTTSPKTGRELPDTVLRPNHALRTQILAWRESQGLPPLPPWEPEPQEVVQQQRQQHGQQQGGEQRTTVEGRLMRAQGVGTQAGPSVTVQTVAGSVTVPLTMVRPQLDEASIARALQASPAMRDELLAAWREGVEANSPVPSLQELPRIVLRTPRLMEIVLRIMQQDPEIRAQIVATPPNMATAVQERTNGAAVVESPLFRAARQGECGVVEQLLGLHGEIDGQRMSRELSAQGDTLLHVASWFGHPRLVSMLVARGHPIHVPSRNRSMPLHYAAFRGHTEVVRVLLGAQADTERRMMGGDTAVHQAAWSGHLPVLSLLLQSRASLLAAKDNGDTALALAAARQHVALCAELVSCIAESGCASDALDARNASGRCPIHHAASVGSVETVQLLLNARAQPDVRSDAEESPLHMAAESGALSVCRALLEAEADVDPLRPEDEHTPLHIALLQGKASLAGLLIERNASLTAERRRDGMTVVHMAVIFMASQQSHEGEDRHAVLTKLVEARASLDTRARNGLSPLHLALVRFPQPTPHRSVALRALLEHRADLELPLRGERPLHLAVSASLRVETALLIEHRADVNARTQAGATPLHSAARQGSRECAELLLRAGACRHLRDAAGQSASDVARQYGLHVMEQLLLGNSGAPGPAPVPAPVTADESLSSAAAVDPAEAAAVASS